MDTYTSTHCSTTAENHAWSLFRQKRKLDDPGTNHYNIKVMTTSPEASLPSTRLRKRARISYAEFTESDIESGADSGYNSDSSVEWGAHPKTQSKSKRPARKEKPVKPFPFLSLPSELRNKIYSLCLEDPDGMVMGEGWRFHRRVPKRCQHNRYGADRYSGLNNLCPPSSAQHDVYKSSTLVPSLLATNKQIYAEAAAMLYSQPLHFTCTTALHSFLAPLSNTTASQVPSITLHSYETWGRGIRKAMNVSALTLLPKCSNLSILRIEGFGHYYHHHRGGYNTPTVQQRGEYEGKAIAQQMYRDAAFWFDVIGAEKAVQVLDIAGLQRKTCGDEAKEVLRIANEAFKEELASLVKRAGRSVKKGRKSKAARDSDAGK